MFGLVKLKLPSSAGVFRRAFSLRSGSFSVAACAGARLPRRAVSSGIHFCDIDAEEVLPIFPKITKSGDSDPKGSFDDRQFSAVVSILHSKYVLILCQLHELVL